MLDYKHTGAMVPRVIGDCQKPVYVPYAIVPSVAGQWIGNSVKHDANKHGNGPRNWPMSAQEWFQTFWEPCISCTQQRLGNLGEGGKWVCPELVRKQAVLLSVGSHNIFDFEVAMQNAYTNVTFDVFDPNSDPPTTPIPQLTFHRQRFDESVFISIVKGPVDILKIDWCAMRRTHSIPVSRSLIHIAIFMP